MPAENADLLKPVLLCGKGLVSTQFSLGEFLAFGIEFLSQNRDAGYEPNGLGFSPMLSQIQNRVLKAGFLHARNACPNHRTAVVEHMASCMKDSKVDSKPSSLCEMKKYFKSQKMWWNEKLSSQPGVLVSPSVALLSFLTGSAGLCLPWMCSSWSGAKGLWRCWQNNQHVSHRRRATDPEALLVYFGRVKAIQGYIDLKPLPSLRSIIRKAP